MNEIELRLARPEDAAGILGIYAPYCESSTVSFEIVSPTIDQMRERIVRITARFPWLICEIDGEAAGYVYASQHRERAAYRWAVDVAVYVATTHQRRGLGRGLYTALFSMLRQMNYFKAFAGITLPNDGSVGLHETVGFRQIAVYEGVGYKAGRWLDVGWWELALQPEIGNPPEPLPFRQICSGAAVSAALADARRMLL
jgi:phosphinothricin acetyltransferase